MIASSSRRERFSALIQEKVFFGNKPTPELIAILTIYFVQGIIHLARLAVNFFLKDDLGLSPAEVSALMGIATLPWVIKPAFGFLSDGLPVLGYRRRPYLVLSGILGSSSWFAFATIVDTAWAATAAMLLTSVSVAISDVIVDSLVVERARKESLGNAGSLQSLSWGASALGGVITAYLSGWLLEVLSSQMVFAITGTFPLVIAGVAWLISEEPVRARQQRSRGQEDKKAEEQGTRGAEEKTDQPLSSAPGHLRTFTPIQPATFNKSASAENPEVSSVRNQIKQLLRAVTQKSIWLPTAFIFLWQATPTADSAIFFFSTNELGFEPEFLGRVRLVTSIASLIGIWIFQRFLRTVPFRTILGWSIFLSSVLGMTTLLLVTHANRTLGIDDHWFSLGDQLILTVMGQVAFMPVLVLSARLCPAGVEATLFALLMSVWNLSGLVSQEMGALLTHWLGVTETKFDNLWLLVLITNLSTLLPLPFLGWLPASDPQKAEEPRSRGAEEPGSATSKSLPPAEVFANYPTGSQLEQPLIPQIAPEFATIASEDEGDE
ncbi:MAG: folate/biopterin family MFS transporter [Cyanobacteria bacterium QH_8_48_120]|nr:MAG: folate/biopterin family MFS transporter [Cyanobacteria bacterium QH_8_48_120]PSP36314.1 MAG: folate/biopterin family MFS transporter [Cyanobacteria bacterium QS_8_48_54]